MANLYHFIRGRERFVEILQVTSTSADDDKAARPASLIRVLGRLLLDAPAIIVMSLVIALLLVAMALGAQAVADSALAPAHRGFGVAQALGNLFSAPQPGDSFALQLQLRALSLGVALGEFWRHFGFEDTELLLLFGFSVGIVLYVAVVLALLALARLRRGPAWRDYVAWRPAKFERLFLVLAAAGVAWGIAAGSVIEANYPGAKQWFALPHGVAGMTIAVALIVFAGPLAEEMLFRGWLYTALRPALGVGWTLFLTAALFAIAHWENTHLYALAVFPVGLLLGYARERSGSIKPTFAFHATYNFAGWLLATLAGK